jgi:hypothetical protein
VQLSIVRNKATASCDSRQLDRRSAGKVVKHFVDDQRVSDIGDNTQPAAAFKAVQDVDIEDPFQSFCPAKSCKE